MSEALLRVRAALFRAIDQESAFIAECDRAILAGTIGAELVEVRSNSALRRAKAEALIRQIDSDPDMIETMRAYAANVI